MSLAESLEFSVISADLYFASDLWKQKIQSITSRDEMRLQSFVELKVISQKLTVLLKRPPVIFTK